MQNDPPTSLEEILSSDEASFNYLDKICLNLKSNRTNPLLVLYYPATPDAMMSNDDMSTVYNEFRRSGFSRDTRRVKELDVLIHTLGGQADVGYMLGQIIRSFSDKVNFIIPFHSASAGTLTCLSGNKILFASYAYLTPIDVSLGTIPLMSLDYFTNFAVECRQKVEQMFQDNGFKDSKSTVEADLLVQLAQQIDGINIGRYYRERTLTGYYAHRLLNDYMFADSSEREELSAAISHDLIFSYPAHEFYLDFIFSKNLKLPEEELPEDQSDVAKKIVRMLDLYTNQNIACKEIEKGYRMPFIKMYG